VFLILFYIGFTTSIPLYSAIRARYFGRKSIGSIQGSAAMIMMPFGVIAPVYAGWIYDRTGNYNSAFALFGGLLAVAILVLLFARPPRPPEEAANIRKIL
jgi:nitrate/nitrite transporter NarK